MSAHHRIVFALPSVVDAHPRRLLLRLSFLLCSDHEHDGSSPGRQTIRCVEWPAFKCCPFPIVSDECLKLNECRRNGQGRRTRCPVDFTVTTFFNFPMKNFANGCFQHHQQSSKAGQSQTMSIQLPKAQHSPTPALFSLLSASPSSSPGRIRASSSRKRLVQMTFLLPLLLALESPCLC